MPRVQHSALACLTTPTKSKNSLKRDIVLDFSHLPIAIALLVRKDPPEQLTSQVNPVELAPAKQILAEIPIWEQSFGFGNCCRSSVPGVEGKMPSARCRLARERDLPNVIFVVDN